jgi:hypothetical protein
VRTRWLAVKVLDDRNGSVTAVTLLVLFFIYSRLVLPSNTPCCRRRRFERMSSDKNDNEEHKSFAVGGLPWLYKDGWEAVDDESYRWPRRRRGVWRAVSTCEQCISRDNIPGFVPARFWGD